MGSLLAVPVPAGAMTVWDYTTLDSSAPRHRAALRVAPRWGNSGASIVLSRKFAEEVSGSCEAITR
jgi:hypothetical protein